MFLESFSFVHILGAIFVLAVLLPCNDPIRGSSVVGVVVRTRFHSGCDSTALLTQSAPSQGSIASGYAHSQTNPNHGISWSGLRRPPSKVKACPDPTLPRLHGLQSGDGFPEFF